MTQIFECRNNQYNTQSTPLATVFESGVERERSQFVLYLSMATGWARAFRSISQALALTVCVFAGRHFDGVPGISRNVPATT